MKTPAPLALAAAAAVSFLSVLVAFPAGAGAQPGAAPHDEVVGSPAEQAQPTIVTVDLLEWAVRPSVTSVAAGTPVRFVARNTGGFSHQLQVTAPGVPNVQSAVLAPGESYSFELTFGAAVTAQLLCPIGNVERDEPVPGLSHRQRGMETAFNVTAPAAGVSVAATPALPPAPTVSALTAPGANVDRISLPADYQKTFGSFYVFDRPDNRQVRHVYANTPALSARQGQRFPNGSVLVMETWRAKLGADNQPALDANGRYQKDELTGIFAMKKDAGFGVKYGLDQTGEWEYVAYRPDMSGFQTAPERSQACAQCHLVASDGQRDWVVRANLFFAQRGGLLGAVTGLPRTGGHGGPSLAGVSLAPFALAFAGPAVALAGLAARSLVWRRTRRR